MHKPKKRITIVNVPFTLLTYFNCSFPFYHLLCSCFLSQVYCRFLCSNTNAFLVWVIMLRVIKWKHQFPEIIARFLHLWLDFCVSFSRPFLPLSSWISLITLFHRKYSSVHTSVFSINVVFPILYFPAECFAMCFLFYYS